MKALLIAGGFGTRLRPLTYTRPKHLLPIANRPHIEHVLDLLLLHGIGEVVLLTSYMASAFEHVIARARERGIGVEVAHEEEPLGTAGAIKNAEHLLDAETFFAFNGDVLSSVDLSAALAFHREKGALGTLVLTPVEDPSAFGVVPTDGEGRVRRFVEKPPPGTAETDLINAGIYILEPAILASIPRGRAVSIEREVFPRVAEEGKLFAIPTDAYWMDIGTPEKYLQANMDALEGRFPTDAAPGDGSSVIASSATIAPGARVSSACIGERCVIEGGAIVEGSVLLDGVVVSRGARVNGSILGEGVRAAEGASISGTTAGDGDAIDR